MSKTDVSHRGKVVKMTPQATTVAILQEGACAGCHAAGLCGMGEVAEKAVEVPADPYATYRVGDEVELVFQARMGLKAATLAYFVPLLVLLGVLLGLLWAGVGEVAAAGISLGTIALYYLVLWLLRGKLKSEYVFTIKN